MTAFMIEYAEAAEDLEKERQSMERKLNMRKR